MDGGSAVKYLASMSAKSQHVPTTTHKNFGWLLSRTTISKYSSSRYFDTFNVLSPDYFFLFLISSTFDYGLYFRFPPSIPSTTASTPTQFSIPIQKFGPTSRNPSLVTVANGLRTKACPKMLQLRFSAKYGMKSTLSASNSGTQRIPLRLPLPGLGSNTPAAPVQPGNPENAP